MSVEKAKAFVNRITSDQTFAKQLLEHKTDEERQKFAADAGYVFTTDDLQKILPAGVTIQDLKNLHEKSELPDEMLEAIVGGSAKGDQWEAIGIEMGIDTTVELIVAAASI